MAHRYLDRCKETSTTTSTTDFVLAGAVSSDFQTFAAAGMTNNDTCPYYAELPGSGQWEEGLGTWVTGGTLQRTTVSASSNSGSKVSFSAGTKIVGCGLRAGDLGTGANNLLKLDASGNIGVERLNSGTSAGSTTFWRGDGTWAAPAGGSVNWLATLTASTSATLDDTTHITSAYDHYLFVLENIVPATNNVYLLFRVTKDGGSTFETTSYMSTDTSTNGISLSAPYITFTSVASANVSNTSGVGLSGQARFGNVNSSVRKMISFNGEVLVNGAAAVNAVCAGGYWDGGNNAINGVRFLFSSGNISTGKIHIYGVAVS